MRVAVVELATWGERSQLRSFRRTSSPKNLLLIEPDEKKRENLGNQLSCAISISLMIYLKALI